MHKNNVLKTIFAVVALAFAVNVAAQTDNKSLFSAKNQDKWSYVLSNKALQPTALFNFDNGILKVSGGSTGYIRTKKEYKNFTLSVEWRWTKTAANSGVLIAIQRDTVWPPCFQVQQKAGAAGDIICMNGLTAKECIDTVNFTVPKLQPSNEKPVGEWNELKIICRNGSMTVYVNRTLQNRITEMSAKKGFIGLQAEGKPLEFRNLIIKK